MSAQERKRNATVTFVHASARMADILREVAVIAASPVPMVLVTGDSGTGKQAIARMLHDGSARAGRSLRRAQLFGDSREPGRKRTVWARAGRVLRRP